MTEKLATINFTAVGRQLAAFVADLPSEISRTMRAIEDAAVEALVVMPENPQAYSAWLDAAQNKGLVNQGPVPAPYGRQEAAFCHHDADLQSYCHLPLRGLYVECRAGRL